MEPRNDVSGAASSVAIIGTGPAGLVCGHLLHKTHDVTLYEKNDWVGGHAHTATVDEDGTPVRIDTAFVIFSPGKYPLFNRLLTELGVRSRKAPMHLSVRYGPSGLEYAFPGFLRLFADVGNVFRWRFLRMVRQLWRFQGQATEVLRDRQYESWTIADYVAKKGYGEDFLRQYLLPVISGLWSLPPDDMLSYPVVTLVRFLKHHELMPRTMYYINRWRTIVGGSATYTAKLVETFKDRILLERPVTRVVREGGKVAVIDGAGERRVFDRVIVACHADEALSLLEEPTPDEQRLLARFKYASTRVVLHTDAAMMPRRRRAWSSWNYRVERVDQGAEAASFTYHMNSLQRVSKKRDYFITVNDHGLIDPSKILQEFDYRHPLFDHQAIEAQGQLAALNDRGPIYFAGSYFNYGFHEDAIRSGVDACRRLTGEAIWT